MNVEVNRTRVWIESVELLTHSEISDWYSRNATLASHILGYLESDFRNKVEEQLQVQRPVVRNMLGDEADTLISMQREKMLEEYPNHVRNGLFVLSWSDFEGLLYRVVEVFGQLLDVDTRLSAFKSRDRGVIKVLSYLRIHFGLQARQQASDQLANFSKLRNCIVHNQARVPLTRNYAQLREYITERRDIRLSEVHEILVTDDFISHSCSRLFDLLENLHSAAFESIKDKRCP